MKKKDLPRSEIYTRATQLEQKQITSPAAAERQSVLQNREREKIFSKFKINLLESSQP
jgi:hypothetical protein